MKFIVSIVLCVSLSYSYLFAQEFPKREIDISILADELFGVQDLELNYQELYENLALLLANPINLNNASIEDLRFLNLLSEYQIQSFLQYRTENGQLLSVYELQSVPGFDLSTIYRIIPFVKTAETKNVKSLWTRIISEENNYFILRYDKTLEKRKGYTNTATPSSRFTGSPDDIYMRFRVSNPGDFSLGFTCEKDAGEQFNWNPSSQQYGFDYYSVHAQVVNKGKLKNAIIGDYQTQFGQGLVLSGSFGYGKGSETVNTLRRSNVGFLPYTSVNETGFKRGAAFTYEIQPGLLISPFYSIARRDASLVIDSTEEAFASSLQNSGLHRTETEIKNRKQLQEQNYGVVVNFRKNSIDAGVILNRIAFNVPINRTPAAYNAFSFGGTENTNTGLFLNYTIHNFTFFSEFANSFGHGSGVAAGILGSLTPKLDFAFHYRNYQRDFFSINSNAFSESSIPQNESGTYWGLKYRWNKKFSATGYADLFQFPWLRYQSYTPSEGHEWLIRVNYQPSKTVLLFVQIREESKVRNLSTENTNLYETGTGVKKSYWINCDYTITPHLKLKTRAQMTAYDFQDKTTHGMLLLQDVSLDIWRVSLTARYALFDTDNYDNRQYVYEHDVWLAYSLPAYSGIGIRNYILAQYTVNKHLTFWLRYAHTRFTDRETIGSGGDTIEGNVRNDIRMQMRIRF